MRAVKRMREKRGSLIAKIFVFAFAAYAAISLISIQIQSSEKRAEIAWLEDRMDLQTQKNASLRGALEAEIDSDYMAAIAREKLGYVMPGESIFEDISGK